MNIKIGFSLYQNLLNILTFIFLNDLILLNFILPPINIITLRKKVRNKKKKQ